KMLVAAPLSTLKFTCAREIVNTIPSLRVRVLIGDAEKRRKLLAEDADIYIINHAGLRIISNELRKRLDINVYCFDEAAAYRNAQTERSKMARFVSQDARYVWGMTGSPTPTEPTDAYGLARLITPRTAPHSYLHFRQAVMKQIDKWRWVPKHDAAETVARVLQPATRYTLEDIIELPPVIERDVRVGMGPRQWAAYDQLKDHMATLLKDGMITAANGGVLYSKLPQESLGGVYDEDKGVHAVDNGARIDALLDIIESVVDTTDTTRKVIVFSAFKPGTRGMPK